MLPLAPGARHDWRILTDLMGRIGLRRGGLAALTSVGARALAAAIGSGAALDLLLRVGPHALSLRELARAPHGIDLGPLRPRIRDVIGTPDRSINLVPALLEKDLARLEERLGARPEAPFSLVSRRTLRSMNSWLANCPRLVKGKDRCTLLMNPADAAGLGVTSGGAVEIASRVGRIRARVEVSDEMMIGVVSLPHGWGHDRPGTRLSVAAQHAGVSMNDVTDERRVDHVSGTSVVDGVPVTIMPVQLSPGGDDE